MAKKSKVNRKRRLPNSQLLATGVALASFTFNSQLDTIVRADDAAISPSSDNLVVDGGTSPLAPDALLASEEVSHSTLSVSLVPLETFPQAITPEASIALDPEVLSVDNSGAETTLAPEDQSVSVALPLADQNRQANLVAQPLLEEIDAEPLTESERVVAEALSEDLKRLFTDEQGNPTSEASPQVAPLQAADASQEWLLNGLGNTRFASLRYSEATGQLTWASHGRPHTYYGDRQYAGVSVTRDGELLFDQRLVGNQIYRDTSSGILRAGDQVRLYHEEPARLTVSSEELKASAQASKEYFYEVNPDLTLKNVTDLVLLNRDLSALFVDKNKQGLSFGTTEATIAALASKVADSTYRLSEVERDQLREGLAQARALLDRVAWDIPINDVMTKTLTILPSTIIAGTEREGRPLGTRHDRQDLGLLLKEGSEIRIRQINPAYKGSLTLRLFGDDSRLENHVDFQDDWVSLRALEDMAAFVDTPVSDEGISPVIAYEVVSGHAKTLPVFTYGDDQAAFIQEWDRTKAAYALLKAHNIHLLAPLVDLPVASSKDLTQLIRDYDTKVFAVMDGLTDLPSNTASDHIKGIYFAKANKNGIGTAYYTRTHMAQTSASMASYLDLGWLTLHEIAHGYEVPSTTMPIIDVFNNLYGAVFQGLYLDNPEQESWVYDLGKKPSLVNHFVNEFVSKGTAFADASYRERLNALTNMLTLRGTEAFTQFNRYHREQAVAGRDIRDLASLWVEFFAKEYQLDVTPFYESLQVPIQEMVKTNNARAGLTPVAMLAQVVPLGRLDQAMATLGWDKEFLKTKISLISNEELAQLGLKSRVSLSLENPEAILGTQLAIMNGQEVVKTVMVTDGVMDLGELPNGIYTFKHDNPRVTLEEPYLYVREFGHTSRRVSMDTILSTVEAIYTDSQYTTLKPDVELSHIAALKAQMEEVQNPGVKADNLALLDKAYSLINQWDFKGLGERPFARLRYLNRDQVLYLSTLPIAPHAYFADQYAKIEVLSPTGEVAYSKTYLGNQELTASDEVLALSAGSRLLISHREPARLSVHPEGLKNRVSVNYTYEVTPSGRLRLLGDNRTPEILSDQEEVVVEVGTALDLTSLIRVYDADEGNLVLDPEMIQTDLDLTKEGQYRVTYRVTDSEGASARYDLRVRVVAPIQALPQEQTVDKENRVDPRLSIANADSLPTSTSYAFKDSLNTSVPGLLEAIVVVILDNGSRQEVPVTIRVRTDAERLVPVSQAQETAYGQPLDPQAVVRNLEDLPTGTQVVWGPGLDLKSPGRQEVSVTVFYPDGSQEDLLTTVQVRPQAASYQLTAQSQILGRGGQANPQDSVLSSPELPEGATVIWSLAPDSQVAGLQAAEVLVSFEDGSSLRLPVTVRVDEQAGAYRLVEQGQTVALHGQADPRASLNITPDLPETAQIVWAMAPDTSTAGDKPAEVLILFVDGSSLHLPVTVHVQEEAAAYDLTGQAQVVAFGQLADPAASLVITPGLPAGAQVAWVLPPNSQQAGLQEAILAVSFADGSQRRLPVTVRVEAAPEPVPIALSEARLSPVVLELPISHDQPLELNFSPIVLEETSDPVALNLVVKVALEDLPPLEAPQLIDVPLELTGDGLTDTIIVPRETTVLDVTVTSTSSRQASGKLEVTLAPTTQDGRTKLDITVIEPVQSVQPTPLLTYFVDQAGQDLLPAREGNHQDIEIPGYQLLALETDAAGNTRAVYSPLVQPTLPSQPEEPVLAETPVVPNQPIQPVVEEQPLSQHGAGETAEPLPVYPIDQVPANPIEPPVLVQPTLTEPKLTRFVDQDGQDLLPAREGSHKSVVIPGYQLVSLVTDARGQVMATYNSVETATPARPAQPAISSEPTAFPQSESPVAEEVLISQHGTGETAEALPVYPLDQVPANPSPVAVPNETTAVPQSESPVAEEVLISQHGTGETAEALLVYPLDQVPANPGQAADLSGPTANPQSEQAAVENHLASQPERASAVPASVSSALSQPVVTKLVSGGTPKTITSLVAGQVNGSGPETGRPDKDQDQALPATGESAARTGLFGSALVMTALTSLGFKSGKKDQS